MRRFLMLALLLAILVCTSTYQADSRLFSTSRNTMPKYSNTVPVDPEVGDDLERVIENAVAGQQLLLGPGVFTLTDSALVISDSLSIEGYSSTNSRVVVRSSGTIMTLASGCTGIEFHNICFMQTADNNSNMFHYAAGGRYKFVDCQFIFYDWTFGDTLQYYDRCQFRCLKDGGWIARGDNCDVWMTFCQIGYPAYHRDDSYGIYVDDGGMVHNRYNDWYCVNSVANMTGDNAQFPNYYCIMTAQDDETFDMSNTSTISSYFGINVNNSYTSPTVKVNDSSYVMFLYNLTKNRMAEENFVGIPSDTAWAYHQSSANNSEFFSNSWDGLVKIDTASISNNNDGLAYMQGYQANMHGGFVQGTNATGGAMSLVRNVMDPTFRAVNPIVGTNTTGYTSLQGDTAATGLFEYTIALLDTGNTMNMLAALDSRGTGQGGVRVNEIIFVGRSFVAGDSVNSIIIYNDAIDRWYWYDADDPSAKWEVLHDLSP